MAEPYRIWLDFYGCSGVWLFTGCSHGALLLYSGDIGTHTEAYIVRLKDTFGLSFFDIDHDTVHGSIRIARLMASLGLETAEPKPAQYEYGLEAAKEMESWPNEGSIRCENGNIIVKLSE